MLPSFHLLIASLQTSERKTEDHSLREAESRHFFVRFRREFSRTVPPLAGISKVLEQHRAPDLRRFFFQIFKAAQTSAVLLATRDSQSTLGRPVCNNMITRSLIQFRGVKRRIKQTENGNPEIPEFRERIHGSRDNSEFEFSEDCTYHWRVMIHFI